MLDSCRSAQTFSSSERKVDRPRIVLVRELHSVRYNALLRPSTHLNFGPRFGSRSTSGLPRLKRVNERGTSASHGCSEATGICSGACEGTLTCSTCHVILRKEDYDRLPEKPTDEELDMLDLAHGLCDT
ncbi:2Fe-2S ferredoxin [Capsicum chinense]|nr:2Fe-2S ferredoxin [Capsicum chinense]